MSIFLRLFSLMVVVVILVTACDVLNNPKPDTPTPTATRDCEKLVHLQLATPPTLYVGITHELILSAYGVDTNAVSLQVSSNSETATITQNNATTYQISPLRPGNLELVARGSDEAILNTFPFQVRRLPDPIAFLGRSNGGQMANGEFKAQAGVLARWEDVDFDASCTVTGFHITYLARQQDPIEVQNEGVRYTAKARRVVNQAKPGDVYTYTNIRAKCPGDQTARKLNSMVFFIR